MILSNFLQNNYIKLTIASMCGLLLAFFLPNQAMAQPCAVSSLCYYDCYFCQQTSLPALENAVEATVDSEHNATQSQVTSDHNDTRDHITLSHSQLRVWFSSELFTDMASVHLQDAAEQVQAVSAAAVMSIGTFFDAQNHVQTQTLLSKLSAKAHKDYIPSSSVCVFGTSTNTLAAAEGGVKVTKSSLSQRYIARLTGEEGSSGSSSNVDDLVVRTQKFRSLYCDPKDNSGRLGDPNMCATGGQIARYNNDINYASLIDSPLTLNVNFTDGAITQDEEDIFALSNNLYSHRLLSRPKDYDLTIVENKKLFLRSRELFAKKSITNNTFNNIVAMKSPANSNSTTLMLQALGLPLTEAEIIAGANPSYYAQMDLLTKKLYQNPAYYSNLIDTPANIERQQAALQAFELMQSRDMYDSLLRSEMMLSVLLEASLRGVKNRTDYNLSLLKENQE